MDSGTIIKLIESIGLPTALSIYLLHSNNKHMEKYEILIEKITGEIKKINDNFKDIQQDK